MFLLDVSENFSVGELKEILEVEFGTPRGEMALVYNMAIMADDQALSAYNVHDGDVVVMTKSSEPPVEQPQGSGETIPNIDWASLRLPSSNMVAGSSTAPAQASPPVDER